MVRRRSVRTDNPLLITLFTVVIFVAWVGLMVAFAFLVFASRHDAASAGGRAACELVAPESNGAFQHPPEVAVGSTSRVAAPP